MFNESCKLLVIIVGVVRVVFFKACFLYDSQCLSGVIKVVVSSVGCLCGCHISLLFCMYVLRKSLKKAHSELFHHLCNICHLSFYPFLLTGIYYRYKYKTMQYLYKVLVMMGIL